MDAIIYELIYKFDIDDCSVLLLWLFFLFIFSQELDILYSMRFQPRNERDSMIHVTLLTVKTSQPASSSTVSDTGLSAR